MKINYWQTPRERAKRKNRLESMYQFLREVPTEHDCSWLRTAIQRNETRLAQPGLLIPGAHATSKQKSRQSTNIMLTYLEHIHFLFAFIRRQDPLHSSRRSIADYHPNSAQC